MFSTLAPVVKFALGLLLYMDVNVIECKTTMYYKDKNGCYWALLKRFKKNNQKSRSGKNRLADYKYVDFWSRTHTQCASSGPHLLHNQVQARWAQLRAAGRHLTQPIRLQGLWQTWCCWAGAGQRTALLVQQPSPMTNTHFLKLDLPFRDGDWRSASTLLHSNSLFVVCPVELCTLLS